jgi:hypothetical protein
VASQDDAVRALICAHLAGEDDKFSVEGGRAGTIVRAGAREWIVRAIEEGRNFQRSPGYVLYDVAPAMALDPPAKTDGVAALGDEMYHLNESSGLKAFWERTKGKITPAELASLLAWYQSDAPGRETVVANAEDIVGLLFPEQRERLELTVSPEVIERAGEGEMAFSTVFLSRDTADGLFRANFNGWSVRWDAVGGLNWSYRPVARGLLGPRYMP